MQNINCLLINFFLIFFQFFKKLKGIFMKSKLNLFALLLIILNFLSTDKLLALVENAKNPQIITNGDGKYVYAIWAKNDSEKDIIQITISSDYAQTWPVPDDLSTTGQNAAMAYLANDIYQRFIYGIWTRSNGSNDIVQFSYSKGYPFENWSSPINLSDTGENANNPKAVTNFIGKNIYAIWARSNGTNDIIQFCKSTDFGQNFSSAIDLSIAGFSATNQQISTNENQNFVCTVWQRSNGTNDIIQFRNSLDYGENWSSIADLSTSGQNANNPQIKTTDNMLYTIWIRSNGTNDIVQLRSSIFTGNSWSSVLDLSTLGQNAINPQITADQSGKKAYAIWVRSNGSNDIIQMSYTSDFSATWSSPIDLSATLQSAENPQIITDDMGQNIYATWVRSNGSNDIIQESHSIDFGATWSSPIDLSDTLQNAKNPQITVSDDGVKTYIVWTRSDGIKDVIQMSSSQFYGSSFSDPQSISNYITVYK
ncbi:MAG: hypothetical protein K940chlam5_00002 [Candidatus Anoxychlamydiales bacterium]|nr:hypothetical protein [Candidatus Anoxychlamydiales bacterium]